MKKIMFFAAVAAVISLASCQKEALNEAAGTESPVFTATISTGTKTTVDASNGKVAWESTDKITITDAYAASAIYKIKSIDGNTGKATFEVESGTLGQGPYIATFGTAPTTAQTYSATPGNLYMTASSETASLTFSVQCGLMEINLTKAGESVKSIAVTGTPTGESETTYTLTCTEAQSIAEKTAFYISVAAGSYNKIVITDSEDKVCTLTAASGITVAANHIKPVTFEGSKLDFLHKGALPGVFTVGPNATDKVHFSQGNLWYGKVGDAQTATFNFEANQYDTTPASDDPWSSDHISHFFWSRDARVAYSGDYDAANSEYTITPDQNDVFFTNKDGFTVNVGGTEQTGWRTLSTAEWQYLFNDRTDAASKVGFATVGGVKGIIILPDNFTDPMKNNGSGEFFPKSSTGWNRNVYTSGDNWNAMETAGAVFLPAAGYRAGSDVYCVGGDFSNYWSSTPNDSESDYAYCVYFDSYEVRPDGGDRYLGFSVRLITESN